LTTDGHRRLPDIVTDAQARVVRHEFIESISDEEVRAGDRDNANQSDEGPSRDSLVFELKRRRELRAGAVALLKHSTSQIE
jgi:hypothetical protein